MKISVQPGFGCQLVMQRRASSGLKRDGLQDII